MTTPIEKPCDFGHYLRLNREAKGKTLEEIAAITKISIHVLRRMEAEDLSNLPPPVFLKGFVRAYAAAVGADVAETMQRLESCSATTEANEPEPVGEKPKSFSVYPRLILAVIVLSALIVLTLLIANRINRPAQQIPETLPSPAATNEAITGTAAENTPSSAQSASEEAEAHPSNTDMDTPLFKQTPGAEPAVETPAMAPMPEKEEPVSETVGNDTAAAADSQQEAQAAVAPKPVPGQILQIYAIEPTWLSVSSDDGPLTEMTLRIGEEVTLKASDHFKLLIGNAGGIVLTLNGRVIGVPGESKQVVNLRLPRQP